MKTAIIYYSKHHENTKMLLDAIKAASADEITMIDVTKDECPDLTTFDMVGFASGIYYSKFEKRVLSFAQEHLSAGKEVFLIYTFGAKKKGYTKAITEVLDSKNAKILGEYGCLGFNTYGPFKIIGGIAKGHPAPEEVTDAIGFYNSLKK